MVFHHGEKVKWSCVDLKRPLLHYCWRSGEVTGLTDKCVHEGKREFETPFVEHEHFLSSGTARFKAPFRLSCLDGAFQVTQEVFRTECLHLSSAGVVVSALTVTEDYGGD